MNSAVWDLNSDKLIALAKQGKRADARKVDEYRPVTIERDVSKNAEGSARVKIGNTEVVVGVKMFLEKPYPDTPNKGSICVGTELLSLASPEFEPGPPNENSIELARVIDRGIRESKALDFESFCVEEGEKAWFVFIDSYIINHDGNLFDASSIAALAALTKAKIPKLEDGEIVKGEYDGLLKLERLPLHTTHAKVGNAIFVDPTYAEEKAMSARFSVATTDDGFISAFQKGKGGAFTAKELDFCIENAFKKAKEIRKLL